MSDRRRNTIPIDRARHPGFVQSGFNEVAHQPIPPAEPRDLTEPSRFPSMVICDSRCGLVKEASLHDETSFQ